MPVSIWPSPSSRQRSAGNGERDLACVLAAGVALLLATPALAQLDPDPRPGHLDYAIEIESHALVSVVDPRDVYSSEAAGLGLRLSIPVADDGWLPSADDLVAVSLGLDWARYEAEACASWGAPRCTKSVPGVTAPDGFVGGVAPAPICVEAVGVADRASVPADYFFLPIAMQWSFWPLESLSIFIEPGMVAYLASPRPGSPDFGVHPSFTLGVRGQFGSRTTLTLRLGYPTLSLGVSIFPPPQRSSSPEAP